MDKSPQNILITGSAGGIGHAMVKLFSSMGNHVFATARGRSLEKLKNYNFDHKENISFYELDLNNEKTHEPLIKRIIFEHGKIDVLINNAAISYRSSVEELSLNKEMYLFKINYLAAMNLSRTLIPYFRSARSGHIINISSVGGMMAMPLMSSYCASKFALEGASESLWYELKPWNIKITLIEIGFVRSNSFRNTMTLIDKPESSPYRIQYHKMSEFIEKLMLSSYAEPYDIAVKISKILKKKRPRLRYPVSIDAWFFYYLRRLLPRQFYHQFLYKKLPGIKEWENDARLS